MNGKTILSLYDYSGNWCAEYKKNGYEVIQVDLLLNGVDVRLMKYLSTRKIHGILAATPCTYYSQARKIPTTEELLIGLSCSDAVFRMVQIYKPVFYCIENPAKSRLWRYIGSPKQIVQWNWFGYEAKKPTGLYGNFNPVKVDHSICNTTVSNFENIKYNSRSETPIEFGKAFFNANP